MRGQNFYFVGNHLEAFELKSNQFSIRIKGTNSYAIIGGTLTSFVKVTPEDKSTSITLQHNGTYYDEVLGFIFDDRNKITNIICGPD